ncbi:hypothetical protein B0H11DRAFT_1915515 [Mycena galericulata]|nr:hypothetical protein B0H11DRAFT_1915515 [Mycena galericulata]
MDGRTIQLVSGSCRRKAWWCTEPASYPHGSAMERATQVLISLPHLRVGTACTAWNVNCARHAATSCAPCLALPTAMHCVGCLKVDPQRARIQPHTLHSRESALLAPRVRLSGNAPAAPTPSVTQDHARLPPNPALAGPPALHRELVAAMVTRQWHAIDLDEALPLCTPHGGNAPFASLLVHRASSKPHTVHDRNLRPCNGEKIRGAVLRADADAIRCMRVPRPESFSTLALGMRAWEAYNIDMGVLEPKALTRFLWDAHIGKAGPPRALSGTTGAVPCHGASLRHQGIPAGEPPGFSGKVYVGG